MKNIPTSIALAVCTLAAGIASLPARADDKPAAAYAARGASGPGANASANAARRTLKFNTRHDVAATLVSHRDAAITNGWKTQVRFAGETDMHDCEFDLPKTSQQVGNGGTAIGTIRCTSPWQVYDDGLSFEAFEGGHKVADGTLRP